VTVPAPNAGVVRNTEASKNAMTERIKRLLHVFAANNHDSLVLGAFGCGVFQNNPFDVAVTFRQHLESAEFKNVFKRIIFAVLNAEMYQVFKEVFDADHLSDIQREVVKISLNDDKEYLRCKRNDQRKNVAKQQRKRNDDFKQVYDSKNRNYDNYEDDDE
jgi:hypothetical protein